MVVFLAAFGIADAAVDRQLRTYEDSAYSFENVYFRTGSTVYFRALGTANAANPVFYVRIGATQIEVGLNETSPSSGIYRGFFMTDAIDTDDARDVIKTFNGAIVEIRSDIDGDGIQGTTDVKNITIDDRAPSPPRLVNSRATSSGSVRVNWTEYKGADFRRYTVVRGLSEDLSEIRRSVGKSDPAIVQARQAYEQAGLGPEDIDVVELHDAFATSELIHYEELGLCKEGEGSRLIDEGEVELGGRIPVNPSGGLLAKGHPLGATGVAQIVEIVWQLRGDCGPRQVAGAKVGLTEAAGTNGVNTTQILTV